jgi:hypothetical protein
VKATLPRPDNHESAIIVALPPGIGYTAVVRGVNDTTGVGSVDLRVELTRRRAAMAKAICRRRVCRSR